jgi:hypothetical protein
MLSFILGWGVGSVVVFNRDQLARAVARTIVCAEAGSSAATRHIIRTAARLAEDLEDIVAEARAARAASRARLER